VSYEEVEQKFFDNVANCTAFPAAKAIATLVKDFEALATMDKLNALL
jgi:hypothetical protein